MSRSHTHVSKYIPPKLSVSQFMGYLKGKSSVIDRHAKLKYKYGNRKFWCCGFYIDTVGRNKKKYKNTLRNLDGHALKYLVFIQ